MVCEVELSVQGFHVSVQGVGTHSHKYVKPPTTRGQAGGLAHVASECSGWYTGVGVGAPKAPTPHSCPTLSGMAPMLAPWPPAWQHPNMGGITDSPGES